MFPATREQRCWFHKQANVLAALPKSAHPSTSAAVKDIYNAEDIDKAQVAIKAFAVDYGAKYPKAVAKIVDDADVFTEPNNRSIPVSWVHRKRGDAEVGGSDASALLQRLSIWTSLS